MNPPRIVSLLPAATEIVAALGLAEHLVGISHACDWPREIRHLPVVVRPALGTDSMTPAQIDASVSKHRGDGAAPLYVVDERLLRQLRPTHILAQDLCQVCAPSGNALEAALAALAEPPQLLLLSPRTLTDIALNVREVGAAFGPRAMAEAEALLIEWKARIDDVQARVAAHPRVRCFMMEWVDPIYCSGHWIAQMLQIAGGYDLLARPGQDSVRVSWQEVCAAAPEVLIIAPCGYTLDEASLQLERLKKLPGWESLPAVWNKRVYAVNTDAFIARPGPRIVDGIEMLAYLLHGS